MHANTICILSLLFIMSRDNQQKSFATAARLSPHLCGDMKTEKQTFSRPVTWMSFLVDELFPWKRFEWRERIWLLSRCCLKLRELSWDISARMSRGTDTCHSHGSCMDGEREVNQMERGWLWDSSDPDWPRSSFHFHKENRLAGGQNWE